MLKYGDVLSGCFPSCSLTAFLRFASKKRKVQFGLGRVRNDDKQSRAKTEFQTEESQIESGGDGETLNATLVSCCVVLGNAKVHTGGSKHGGVAC